MADLEGARSIEIAAPAERCFAIAADLDRVESLPAERPVEGLKARAEGDAGQPIRGDGQPSSPLSVDVGNAADQERGSWGHDVIKMGC